MPYIKSNDERRLALRMCEPALTAGELNYQIFYYIKHKNLEKFAIIAKMDILLQLDKDIRRFVKQFLGDNPNYQKYNDMVGCLLLCENEIFRRLKINTEDLLLDIIYSYEEEIAIYEDTKIMENGDVE